MRTLALFLLLSVSAMASDAAVFLDCAETGLSMWPRRADLDGTRKSEGAVRVSWGAGYPESMYLRPPDRAAPGLDRFDRAEFVLSVRADAAPPLPLFFVLFQDAEGEMFQFNATPPEPAEHPGRYTFVIDPAKGAPVSWGKKRTGNIVWPLQFSSFAIPGKHLAAAGAVDIERLACRIVGTENVGLESGGLSVATPERADAFVVEVRNFGEAFRAEVTLTAAEGGGRAVVEQTLPAGSLCRVPVPARLAGDGLRRIDWTVKSAATGRTFAGTSMFSCFPAERDFRIHRLYWGKNREFHDVSYQLEKFSLAFDEQLALHPVAMARHRGVMAGDTLIVAYSAQGRNKTLTLKAPGVFSRAAFPEGDWEGVAVRLENAEQPGVMRGAEPPVFLLENATRRDLRLTGSVRIAAAAAETAEAPPAQSVALGLPRNGTARFAPEGAFDGYGLWYVDFALRDVSAPTAELVHGTRIARIPANPWNNALADGFLFGVNGSSERSDWQRQFPLMQRCGIKMVRGGLPGGAAWLRERGMEPLTGAFPETPSPDWPEKNTEDDPPESLKKFAANAERLAAATIGSQRYFMMKNEGDISRRDYPEDYLVLMQRMAHAAFRKGNPEAKLLSVSIGSLLTQRPWNVDSFWDDNPRVNPDLLRKLFADHRYDALAYHGHCAWNRYALFVDEMKKAGFIGADRPWFAEETAVSSRGPGAAPERAQADALVRKIVYSWANDAVGYIWYDFRNDGNDVWHNEQAFGLLTHSLFPKPAYLAYATMTRLLGDARYVRRLEMPPESMGFVFEGKDGRQIAVLWNDAASNRNRLAFFTGLDAGDVETVDLFGNRVPRSPEDGALLLRLAEHPLFLTAASLARLRCAGEPVSFGELAVAPGGKATLDFRLDNPLASGLGETFSVTLPDGLTGGFTGEVRLAPGERKPVPLGVIADDGYDSRPGSPRYATLALTHGGSRETARVPVFSIIPVDESWTTPLFRLDRPEQMESFMLNALETSPLFWSGPEDLSSSVYCRREGEALRLRFVVTDDIHFQEWRGGRIWLGDTAQVAFKLPGEGRFWEFWFALTAGNEPQVWCWQAPAGTDSAAAAASVRLTATRDETTKTTTYDALIPLATLGLTPEILRDGFRMNVLHTDNDGSGRESHLRAADGMGIDEKNSANFPFVRFPR